MKIYIIGAGVMALALKDGLKETYNIEFIVRDISKVSNIDNLKIHKLDNFNINNLNIILAM